VILTTENLLPPAVYIVALALTFWSTRAATAATARVARAPARSIIETATSSNVAWKKVSIHAEAARSCPAQS